MTIDTEKANLALASLKDAKRARQERIQIAKQAKRSLDHAIHVCHSRIRTL